MAADRYQETDFPVTAVPVKTKLSCHKNLCFAAGQPSGEEMFLLLLFNFIQQDLRFIGGDKIYLLF